MPFKNISLGPGILYDGNGKPIGTCQTESDMDIIFPPAPEDIIQIDDFEIPQLLSFSSPKTFECELEAVMDDIEVPWYMEFASTDPEPFYMAHDGVRYEQIRKHKKKRINKKWAKRYGYREVPCRYVYENCYLSHDLSNDFTITCNKVHTEDI